MAEHHPNPKFIPSRGATEGQCTMMAMAADEISPNNTTVSDNGVPHFGDKPDDYYNNFTPQEGLLKQEHESTRGPSDPFSDKVDDYTNGFAPTNAQLPTKMPPNSGGAISNKK